MRAGKLRDRVQIQQNAGSADSYGDVIPAWATVATRWADVEDQSGGEPWQADQARPQRTVHVSMRYYEGLSSKHRLLFGARILNVQSVINPDGRKREHLLVCVEEC